MSKKQRNCPNCNSIRTIKKGKPRGIQRYFCRHCNIYFRNHRRTRTVLTKHIWESFVFHKQTVRELVEIYKIDRRSVRKYLVTYTAPEKIHTPRIVHITVDATYFGERVEGTSWCIVVARDSILKEDLVWEFAQTETTSVYLLLRRKLEALGYTIASVTGDGFSGIRTAFRDIPFQMCHVHMERLIIRGTTRDPQTEAGQVLLALVRTLHINTDSHTFNTRLKEYLLMYTNFLNERTENPITGETYYTHKKLRSAALSLTNFKRYLFTFEHDKNIPKTTNSIEGRFSHINEVCTVHRGLTKPLKQKLIHSLLLASTVAPTKKKLDEIL